MAPLVRQLLVFLGGIVGFVIFWLSALALLAQNTCLDHGGSLSGPWFACILPTGAVVSWFALIQPFVVIVAAAAVGWPVFFLTRHFIRRIGGPL